MPASEIQSNSKRASNSVLTLKPPYLIYVGDETRATYAKTGAGIAYWRKDMCLGQFRNDASAVDFGLPDLTLKEALAQGAGSLVVGTAQIGGGISEALLKVAIEAASNGMDIVAGLHTPLSSIETLAQAAAEGGARIIDVRVPPQDLPIGTGQKRSGKRLLTVGTDCALGKKYTALQIQKDMQARGLKATFRASGQTGIMIAGSGIPIDAVVSDFLVGAAELLSPENDADHWDVIEGQGAIYHPAYAPVSHGLLLGSQPDAIVLCHEANRTHVSGWPDVELPTIGEAIARNLELAKRVNPNASCVGISVNTSKLPAGEREDYLKSLSDQYDLPCVDPIIDGTSSLIDKLV